MILYSEKQLDDAYKVYKKHQLKHGNMMNKEEFRIAFEELMEVVYD
mgnify:FL=1